MSNRETDAGNIGNGQLPITINGVVLSPKDRKVTWTPWRALNAVKLCFSLLIQIVSVFFWMAAALLHLPKPAFMVMIMVGVGYGCVYMILRRLTVRLSIASALEGQPVDWFIDAAGVRRVSTLFDFHINREGFASFAEDKKRFLFFTSSQNCIVLPKRCLNADQTGSLRTLIATWR